MTNQPNVFLTQDELLELERLINRDHRTSSERDGRVLRSARRALTAAIASRAPKYDCVYKRAHYAFPPSATQAELEAIANARSYRLDVSTDQIDVLARSGRKVATYMVA